MVEVILMFLVSSHRYITWTNNMTELKIQNSKFKILIGTPIHESKGYCLERWLDNVSDLTKVTPCDLLIVDHSPTPAFAKRVDDYCKKSGIRNYEVKHFELEPDLSPADDRSLGVEASQEMIRQEVLTKNYDLWFSWESDQIIPSDSLIKLIDVMKKNNSMLLIHDSHDRDNPDDFNLDMGVTLVSRKALKIGWFMPVSKGKVSLKLSDAYDVNTVMFKKRVMAGGGNYLHVFGVIKPIRHLNNNS